MCARVSAGSPTGSPRLNNNFCLRRFFLCLPTAMRNDYEYVFFCFFCFFFSRCRRNQNEIHSIIKIPVVIANVQSDDNSIKLVLVPPFMVVQFSSDFILSAEKKLNKKKNNKPYFFFFFEFSIPGINFFF